MNRDFTPYLDIAECINYDGFFDPIGSYYKVKLRNSNMMEDSHNNWAEEYIKKNFNTQNINVRSTYSFLYGLTKLNGPAEILVHIFGFVYYSHNPINHQPIIIVPDEKIMGNKVTKEQLDSLFEMMIFNNERPFDNEIFMEDLDDFKKIR